MSALLEVRDLSVIYPGRGRRKDKAALDAVSVSVDAGQTLGVVGESGSGKSTLGNCVLGLVQPAQGTITFDGRDITHLSRRERLPLSTHIQAVFQDPYSSFNPHRTIEQSVGETLTTLPKLSQADRRARVLAMLERVGLDERALAKFPAQFSGGQRQRISIARALLPEPRLVVCDESVSALDLSVQAQVLNLLLELQRERGVAYLFITHDLSVVRHMSTRIAVLQHGHLVEEDDAEVVTNKPTQPYTQRLIRASLHADADLQDKRRRTRRAVALLDTEQATDHADLGGEVLRALEQQAVAEVLVQPGTRGSALESALARTAEGTADIESLIELRASIPELAARTSAEATGGVLLAQLEDARRRLCVATDTRGMVRQCRDLAAAIRAGDRERAQTIVTSLGQAIESADGTTAVEGSDARHVGQDDEANAAIPR